MKKLIISLVVLSLSLSLGSLAYGVGNDEYTVLLLHFNGGDGSTNFIDDSFAGHHTVNTFGNAQIDTAQYKFGGGAGLFDGTGDYLSISDSTDWDFGADDFTIDYWVRFNDISLQSGIVAHVQNEYNFLNIFLYDDKLAFYCNVGGNWISVENAWLPSTNTWYHIAIVRDAGVGTENWHMFVDGVDLIPSVSRKSGADTPFYFTGLSGALTIGFDDDGDRYLDGWLDEFRISKGIARWISNFTPPADEYSVFDPYPPIADAGDDIVASANEVIILDASNSYDPDGTIVNYTWRRLPDNTVLYSGPSATFETKAAGWVEEVIELIVASDSGVSATDTMSILSRAIDDIELTPGPQGPQGPQGSAGPQGEQGPQGPVGITPEEISAMQSQITTLQQQNALQQQQLEQDRYLLEQLPQLKHAIEQLQTGQ